MLFADSLLLLLFPITVVLIVWCYHYVKLSKQLTFASKVDTAIMTDSAVDEFCQKAVIIAEDQYCNFVGKPDVKVAKIIEKAVVIMTDVLLQHGLNPRDYNLPGLIGVARYREGFDDLKTLLK